MTGLWKPYDYEASMSGALPGDGLLVNLMNELYSHRGGKAFVYESDTVRKNTGGP